MISVTVVGRLGGDAEQRQAGSSQVTEFSIAHDEKRGQEKTTVWVRASIWGERGTKLAEYLTKGRRVAVSGALSVREYTDKQGKARTSLEVRVDAIDLLDGGKDDGQRQQQGGGQQGPADDFGGGYGSGAPAPF